MGIHNYDKMYAAFKERVQKAAISERNKQLIEEMNNALVLEGLSKPRLIKYMEILKTFAVKLNKDFDKVTEEDLKKVIGEIQQKNYSPWTKQIYKVIIRRFYKWYCKTPDKEYPPIVKWINIRMNRSEKRLPSEGDLLSEEDVKKLLDVAKHPRDKALLSVLWESGARIGEVGDLKTKNVKFDNYGMVITVQGKTGSRKIRLISSTPHVATWLNIHPFRNEPESPFWVNIGGKNYRKQMSYTNIREMLINLFKEAGIKKKCNPHLFRHSRATFMANHLTEFQMNQYFGWIQGSDMPSTYVHMSGKEVDNAILKMNGIESEAKKEESKLQPRICPRCDTINASDSKHCNKCGGLLDIKEAMEIEEKLNERKNADKIMAILLQDKDMQNLLMEKMRSLGTTLSFFYFFNS